MHMHAPIQVELAIYVTDGTHTAKASYSVGHPGQFLSAQALEQAYQTFLQEHIPEGFRPLTKREFFDLLVEENTGSDIRVAMPGPADFEPLSAQGES